MKTKEQLFREFAEGESQYGSASNTAIQMIADRRVLVGYGYAVYALDLSGVGDVAADFALFGDGYASDNSAVGWAGYSGTTTQHLQEIKAALEAVDAEFAVVDRRLETGQLDDVSVAELIEERAVEPQEYTGHLYRRD